MRKVSFVSLLALSVAGLHSHPVHAETADAAKAFLALACLLGIGLALIRGQGNQKIHQFFRLQPERIAA